MEDLAKIFSSISIIISCMGLFGLTALTITQKTKEIGIRKILGSSVTGIVSLLSKQMIILVAVAYIIATPIGFYVMKKWLQNFAYSVEIGIEVFILSFMLVVVIALLTIISLAFRAAKANPVVSLRYE
jgi:ABC-type antimicrobial peptide transport system permease subunit